MLPQVDMIELVQVYGHLKVILLVEQCFYLYAKGADFVAKDGFYGDYMKDNSILQKKLKS